jgi:transposase InsO family protein
MRFVRQKSDVVKTFTDWEHMIFNQHGRTIKTLCSNNGREYMGKEMQELLREKRIQYKMSAPYTPKHNGVAEQK